MQNLLQTFFVGIQQLVVFTAIMAFISGCVPTTQQNTGSIFKPDESATSIQNHHRQVASNDMWWTVAGDEMGWAHRNVHQLFPTVNLYRNGPVRILESKPMQAIANYNVGTPEGDMTFSSFLKSDQSTTMGVVILHKGKRVFEAYPRMNEYEKPIYWSVTKVLPATIIRIMEERGQINVNKPVKFYLPELQHSDFADITVRNILDMATGLNCQDEYDDRQSCYYQYSITIGDGFRDIRSNKSNKNVNSTLPGELPDNPYDFLKTLKTSKHAPQGQRFSYSGVNTFVLAWLVEKLTGDSFQQVATREIWSLIGAEADASLLAYHQGIPVTHGGLLATLRDVARFGLLFTPSYKVVSNKKIISDQHIAFLGNAGNPNLLINASHKPEQLIGIKHNIYQWDRVYENGYLFKGGWGGQGLLINPKHDLVVVFTGYFKEDYSQLPLLPILFEMLNTIFEVEE